MHQCGASYRRWQGGGHWSYKKLVAQSRPQVRRRCDASALGAGYDRAVWNDFCFM